MWMRISAVVCAMLTLVAAPLVAADVAAGKAAYAVCVACHGANGEGNQALNAPRLAGLDGAYLKRQYAAYASGQRGAAAEDRYGRQMAMMANTLADDAALNDVIAYIHTLDNDGGATR